MKLSQMELILNVNPTSRININKETFRKILNIIRTAQNVINAKNQSSEMIALSELSNALSELERDGRQQSVNNL